MSPIDLRQPFLRRLSKAFPWIRDPLPYSVEAAPDESSTAPDGDASEAAALESFASLFAELVSGLEPRFLPLGENLCQVLDHLHRLGRAALEGFATLRVEIASGALGDLDGLGLRSVKAVQAQLGDLSQRLQPMKEVSTDLGQLRSLGKKLDQIGSYLRACGSNFVIESARHEESRQAFSGLVLDLRDVGTLVETLAEQIDAASCSTLKQLDLARVRIRENLEKALGMAGLMHGAFSKASGEISRFLAHIRDAVDSVERQRNSIGQQTASIMYYLQFGDLVRQQCEHVVAAARDASQAASAADDAERLAVPLIVRTAAAQMDLIQNQVDEAKKRLGDSYRALVGELEQLADSGRDLGCGEASSNAEVSPWKRLKNQLLDLDSIQQQEQRLSEDARKVAGEAGDAVAALHTGMSGVQHMNGKLHFLALNAIVQTAHLGEQGRVLGELAKQVSGVRRECDGIVPMVLQLLDSIGEKVSKLTVVCGSDQLDLGGLQQMERAQSSSRAAMQALLALAASSSEKLTGALAGLDILTALGSELAKHRGNLEAILDRLPASASNAASAAIEARLMERYTMKSERDAHQRAAQGQAAPGHGSDAPFAPDEVLSGVPALASTGADDFELF